MWLPHELPDEVMQDMSAGGLELTREDIYNSSGTGVANAVIRVGATGCFVSPDGLILTNHHVAFGAVQRISTPDENYIEQGFLARKRADEVPAHGYIGYVIQSAEDVTDRVLDAVDPSMSPLDRYMAIENRTKEIVRDAEAGGDVYCEVSTFSGGARYLLYTYLKIKDIRVVYVPSRSIGEYGGDIDNWMWPRHTGDFSFLRAYVAPDGKTAEFSEDNVPYRPGIYLRIAPEGLSEGDFGIIIGFPGRTRRYLTSHALAEYEDFEYPQRIRLYRQMVEILEAQCRADRVACVKVASMIKGINNRLKNNEGMLEGFTRYNLVQRQRSEERRFMTASDADPEIRDEYGTLVNEFEALYKERSKFAMKDLVLDLMSDRGSLISQAILLYKWSIEKQKDDMDREPDYMDREIPDLRRRLRVFQMGFHRGSDRALLSMFLREMMDLPGGQRIQVLDDMFEGKRGAELDKAFEAYLDGLYENTKLDRVEERLRMFDLAHDDLMEEGDAFIDLAANLYHEDQMRIERDKIFEGSLSILMPKWIETIAERSGAIPYPDANGTMRINYGVVEGYSPRDAVDFASFTTLRGVVEKNTGVPPFDCPERILELAAQRILGSYVHPALDDVPVNLLTTHDSTGGNSGSPLLNRRGEVVGCLFDGNYEAMTCDFLFQDDVTRSIHVDIRYVLFVAEFVDGAHNVLQELGLRGGN